jgi:ElaB/YqjD/DUF883 family membrane-anchored ribosome-binding protein
MTSDHTPPEPGPDAGIDAIQADIDKTRENLSETVEALAAKADVKGRAKDKVAEAKDTIAVKAADTKAVVSNAITDSSGSVKPPVPIAAVAAVVLIIIGVVVWRRRG